MKEEKVLECKKSDLLNALTAAAVGLDDGNSADPLAKCFNFDNDRIYTYNNNIGVSVPFVSGVKCAVPSALLLSFLRKLKNDDIMLSFSKGEFTVRQGKRVRVDLAVNSDIMLSFDENIKPPQVFTKLGCTTKQFSEGVKAVSFTVCEDTQKMQLCGIHLGSDSKGTFVESTDRYRMTRVYISDSTKPIDIKIPIGCALSLCALGPKKLGENKGWLYFTCEGEVQYACWTPEEKYPDLEAVKKVVCTKDSKVVKVEFPERIENILDMAGDFASNRDSRVVVSIEDGKAKVSTTGAFGKFKDLCKVKSTGNTAFKLNPKKLIEALSMSLTLEISDKYLIANGDTFWHLSLLDVHQETEEGETDNEETED